MIVKLGDVATYINGYAFKPSDWSTNGLPIIRIQDLTGNSYQCNRYNGEYDEKYEIVDGDVLISWSASLGVYVWKGEKSVLNQHIFKVVFDKCEIDKNFFVHQVANILEKAEVEAHGATMKHLTKKVFDSLSFYLPELEEQRKIAETLDKVSDLIAKRKQQLEKLDLLVKSKFVEMFGDPFVNPKSWNIVVFSDIIQNANNGMARRGNDLDGDIVLRLVELQNGYIDYSSPNRIILNEAEKKRYRLLDKDFLFARVNGNPDNVGRCAVFNDIKDPVYHNDHIIRVHFNDELVNGTFLSVLLNSEYGKSEMRNKIKTSAGQYTISQDGIGAVKSILPPIKLQTQFAEFVQQTEHTKSIIKQSLEKLETLKKALMQEYFG
ncbi:restriction endonuclease subunit S [uncultured Thomasclavelia sp.]|uniref:restriction endonuclease subunit S n=1 Tax=uncultured Thomasclavelia sp. TaxID=3025759 RepID=UPI00262ADDAD|nr:restriction endonuclease subunit S [uncultured Thomasclavelia sp.]